MIHDDAGYWIHPAVLGDAEMDGLAEAIERVSGRSRAGARHLMGHPVVAKLARDSRLIALAEAIVGRSAIPYRATLFDKSLRSNWLVVWHQDTALPLRSRCDRPGWGPWSMKGGIVYAHAPAEALEHVVALRIHIDDCAVTNGPLRVLPGTHRLGVLTDARVQELARSIGPQTCAVERGGVIAMRPLLVHASSKSISESRRRILHIEYAASLSLGSGMEFAIA